jgi:hypothetical protein
MDLGCFTSDGVTIDVPGHPYAPVYYYGEGNVPEIRPSATSTSLAGLAVVMGLPAGELVQVTGTKAGCTVTATFDQFTGRSLMQKGAVSLAHLRVIP